MNDSQSKDAGEGRLLDHDYDGIQELDNALPVWWLWILYGTTIFGLIYSVYYLTGMGPTLKQELNAELAQIEALKPPDKGVSDAAVMAMFRDPIKLSAGKEIYDGKCVPCHGDKGQGIIGPNLTDDFWIHGSGKPAEIAAVITNGVLDKGMPNWGALLKPEEILEAAAYVRSLHGTNPPEAKPPQGERHDFVEM